MEPEQYLQRIFESPMLGMIFWDLSGGISWANQTFLDMMGYTREDLEAGRMNWTEMTPQEYIERDAAAVSELRRSGVLTPFEKEYFRKDGTRLPVLLGGVLLEQEQQQGVSFVLDISERKLADTRLRKEKEFTETALNVQLDTFFLFDPTIGKALRWNRAFRDVSGFTDEEIARLKAPDAYYSPEDLTRTRAFVAGVLKEGRGTIELELICKDGRKVPTEYKVSMICDEQGKPKYMISVGRDITGRKKAEQALKESETRLRIAGQAAYDLIYEWDTTTDTLEWFGDIDSLLGFEPGVISRNIRAWLQLIHPDDRKLLEGAVELHRVSTKPIQFEYRVLHKDGHYRYWKDHALPICHADGRPYRWVGVCTDITERIRAEEERAKLQAQLTQAHKMESVGRLAGGVAHDFNNMLNVILGHAELALESLPPENPLHSHLHEIQNAAQRSADLTRQLLAFARRQTVTPRVLNLNETIDSMFKMLERLIGEDIDLLWQPAPALEPVHVDPSQIDQLLTNLVVNARDAIEGVGKITIETGQARFDEGYCAMHPGFVPGSYVMFAVSDDGRGMDMETKAQIFEPFFTTKNVREGTGLGLATVYGIVKQNNGFINCYSEPGQGTTFRIYLPVYVAEKAARPVEKDEAEPQARGHETILLVEDESAILNLGTQMLEMQGYRVLSASTPGEAIRMAEEHAGEIHLLITDVVMPEMNGRDLSRRLLSLYPDLKCLFMSGYTANVIAHHGVLDEGVHFLQKPFSRKQLTACVRKAFGQEEPASM
ncbi:MAG: PAS domain S-box protein [Planctomycetota bacterium]